VDGRFKDYVVMKAVGAVNGQRGRTAIVKVLRGSRGYGVERLINTFSLEDLWGIFYKLPQEEIEEVIKSLIDRSLVFVDEIKSGAYTYPMLCLSKRGFEQLEALEVTESPRLQSYKEEIWSYHRSYEVSVRGRELEDFLASLADFLKLWKDKAHREMDFTAILDMLSIDYSTRQGLERFFHRVTPDKLKDRWRTRYALDTCCYFISKQLTDFLASLPEREAAVFRCCFGLDDPFTRPREEIIRYYGLPEKDIQTVLKKSSPGSLPRSGRRDTPSSAWLWNAWERAEKPGQLVMMVW